MQSEVYRLQLQEEQEVDVTVLLDVSLYLVKIENDTHLKNI